MRRERGANIRTGNAATSAARRNKSAVHRNNSSRASWPAGPAATMAPAWERHRAVANAPARKSITIRKIVIARARRTVPEPGEPPRRGPGRGPASEKPARTRRSRYRDRPSRYRDRPSRHRDGPSRMRQAPTWMRGGAIGMRLRPSRMRAGRSRVRDRPIGRRDGRLPMGVGTIGMRMGRHGCGTRRPRASDDPRSGKAIWAIWGTAG